MLNIGSALGPRACSEAGSANSAGFADSESNRLWYDGVIPTNSLAWITCCLPRALVTTELDELEKVKSRNTRAETAMKAKEKNDVIRRENEKKDKINLI